MQNVGANANATGIGIALRLASVFLFTAMTLFVRLAAEAPTGQIMFYRSAVALIPILAYVAWRGQLRNILRTQRPGAHVKRSVLGCASMYFSFVSLAYLPLANATAIGFLTPLVVIPLAMRMLGERPGLAVIGTTILGFAGVGLMLAPALQGPTTDYSMLIGVAAGLTMVAISAAVRIQIKDLTGTELPATIAIYFSIVCALVGLATLPLGWLALDWWLMLCLVAAGLAGGLAQLTMTEAMARAPVSSLAPFEFTALVWAIAFDVLVFGALPGAWSLAGAAVIVVAAAMAVLGRR